MRKPFAKLGDHNMICDVTGFKYKASQLKKRWDGLWVRKESWEPRHSADFQRGVKDDPSVDVSRPDNDTDTSSTSGWKSTTTTVPSGTFSGNL